MNQRSRRRRQTKSLNDHLIELAVYLAVGIVLCAAIGVLR